MSFTISTESITKAINDRLNIAVQEVIMEMLPKVQSEVVNRIRAEIPKIVMGLADQYEVQFERHAIVIRVKIEDART